MHDHILSRTITTFRKIKIQKKKEEEKKKVVLLSVLLSHRSTESSTKISSYQKVIQFWLTVTGRLLLVTSDLKRRAVNY